MTLDFQNIEVFFSKFSLVEKIQVFPTQLIGFALIFLGKKARLMMEECARRSKICRVDCNE